MKNNLCDAQIINKYRVVSLLWAITLVLVGLPFIGNAQNFQQTDSEKATVSNMSDEFGTAVSISGNFAIVGSPKEDNGVDTDAGAAYIFLNDGAGNWSFHQKIVAPTRTISDQFGTSVSIAGDYIIVGAILADSNPGTNTNSNEGAAYIFERNTGTGLWDYKQTLVAPAIANSDQFGVSVTITTTGYAAIGANAEDEDENDANTISGAGSTYIFERNSSTGNWGFAQKVVANDRATNDQFGVSVDISGNFLVVGARNEDATTNDTENFGAAYVFERMSGGNWTQVIKLTAPTADRSTSDQFGTSVAIDGNWIVVGANFDDEKDDTGTDSSPLNNAGAAYIFKYDGTNWTYAQKIVSSDRSADDNFGVFVDISGNNVLVSARAEDEDATGSNTLNNAGSAYIFHLASGDKWLGVKKITANNRELAALFGGGIAIDGDNLIVGARRKDDASITDAGEVYFFKNSPFNTGLAFDGSDDYITLPGVNEFKFDVSTALTIEAWVRFSGSLADGQYQSIVTKGNEAWRLRFKGTPDPVLLAFDYDGANEITSSGSPDFKLGSWHHVAVVFDGTTTTKTVTMYIDGVVNNSQTFSSNLGSNDDPVWIGNNVDDASLLDGAIDDLRIWKRVKDITEIQAAKDCQLTGTEPCLLAYFDFSEGFPDSDNTALTSVKNLATGGDNGNLVGFDLTGNSSNFVNSSPTLDTDACTNPINLPVLILEGNGNTINPNEVTFSTTNDTDLGSVVIGNSITRTYTIRNNGTLPLTLTNSTPVQNVGSSDFTIITQPTSTTIAVGGTVTFTIRFTPSLEDASVANISIASNDCNGELVFRISGVGVAVPEINVQDDSSTPQNIASGSTFDLGNQVVGGSAITRTFTIQNTNQGALNLTGTAPNFVTLTGGAGFSIASQPASSVISGNSFTTFQVSFNTSAAGAQTATLLIVNDDADEGSYTINLTAQGVTPEINLVDQANANLASGATVNLGTFTVGSSATTQTFTIQNTSTNASLSLSNSAPNFVTITGDNVFSIASQPPSGTIAAQGTATFQVSFNPSAIGSYTATVSIPNNDSDENPYTITLTAEVNPPASPEITVSFNGTNINSGETLKIDTTAALNTRGTVITILNEGTAALNLNATSPFVLSGTNSGEFSIDATSTTNPLAINATTTFTINLSPTSLGNKTATLTINNDDFNEGAFVINLQSVAVAPPTEPADVTVVPTEPPADANPTTPNAVNVNWIPPTDLTNVIGYRIRRSDGDTLNFTLLQEVDVNTTTFLDLNLVEGIQYYYRVFSFNQFGESAPGPLSSLVYVGVEETQRFAKQTLVFPNPTLGKTNIQFPGVIARQATLKLYNSSGKLLKTSIARLKNQTVTYDMEGLADGRYLLQIQVGDYTIYKQVVKH
ncbi:hypothetical protein BKI52_10645 [marine bacterium AO1-C]|nr:hypothetical protein BKI52_10645 [marine bacterium AO1-C]